MRAVLPTRRPRPGKAPLLSGMLCLGGAFMGCGGAVSLPIVQGDPNKPIPPTIPSFATEIEPVLNNTCGLSGCHAGQFPNRGLRLQTGEAYALLVNIPSQEVPALMRVLPGDPNNSYLVQKLEGTAAIGAQMPRNGPPMSPEFIAMVRRWIAEGAPNN